VTSTIETPPVKTAEQRTQEAILNGLAELGGQRVGTDKIVKEGTSYVLPGTTSIQEDIRFLVAYAESEEKETSFSKSFRYRPWDGAHAFQSALMKQWGTTGIGAGIHSFFGSSLPEMRTIDNGVDSQIQIPWGRVNFPPLDAVFDLGADYDRDLGLLFAMQVTAPKKHAKRVQGLFILIEEELKTNSIYKGKAFTGAEEPSFIDPYSVDRSKVVYSDEVLAQLDANIWSLMRHTEQTRAMGLPLKRAILLAGPYGTGKSLTAMLTAQEAVQNGWTFIQCRPGRDDLDKTLQTARLYQPAVVFFEDVDTLAMSGNPDQLSKLLDMFDGIQVKGTELAMVLTTNHTDKIHKAMLRPGRIDGVTEFGALDHQGFIRLVKAVVPSHLLDDSIDYDEVAAAMDGFLPAFVKEAIDRSMRYALARAGGTPLGLTTADFVHAAKGLRPQLDLMHGAKEGVNADGIGTAMEKVLTKAITSGEVGLYDKDEQLRFTVQPSPVK
jgi:transitional endoplasmic reticulum ATPase